VRTLGRARSGRIRLRALVTVVLMLAPMAVGCVRIEASITVSDEDRVSGQIVAAAQPRDDEDTGPQFEQDLPFAQKVTVSPYDADGMVGSRASFSDLTFAEVPQLADLSRDATGVDVTLRRVGDLVLLEGRVDLTGVTDPEAEITFRASFPGEVTSTNGERIGTDAVEWQLQPGAVSTMSAQSRYTDPGTRSFAAAAIWLGVAAFLVAGLIGYLAWRDRDQTSPRFAAADSGEDLP